MAATRRYFDVALYLLIFTAFGTLASTGRLDAPSVVVVTGALLYRGYILARRRTALLSGRWMTLATLSALAFFAGDEFLISRGFLGALVHFLLFLMLIRLFSAQSDRDRYLLAALSFAMVLAAAVLTVDSTFLFALAGFVLVAIATFMLMEMVHSFERAPVAGRSAQLEHAYRRLSFSITSIAAMLLLLVLLAGAGIFFVLPRVSAGFMSTENTVNDITSGFSDRVELGRIGEIQRSRAVVMHVAIDGGSWTMGAPKLRGISLSHFDGHSWSNSEVKITRPRASDGRFHLASSGAGSNPAAHFVHYRVTMEPFVSDVFFLLQTPESLRGNYRAVAVDPDGDVFNLDSEHSVARYEADSWLRSPARALAGNSPGDAPELAAVYLQLPPLDPRIKRLAEKITARAPSSYERARAIESYLRTHYGYTLELPSTPSADPLADFLFRRGRGHCEYFASSMAIMLRTLGIGSRVVNGFAGSEFNDLTSEYVVRASDAHSWVEAYIPGEGWMEFDPTPSGEGQFHSPWDRFLLYVDALSSFWREWVINYDFSHQLRLTQDATRGSRALVGQAQTWVHNRYARILAWAGRVLKQASDSHSQWGMGAFVLVLFVLFTLGAPRLGLAWQRRRLARRPEKSPQMAASIWYQRMLRQAARRGWKKSPAQTPEEFSRAIADLELKRRVEGFTGHYERARFGGSRDDALRLPELYQEIKSQH